MAAASGSGRDRNKVLYGKWGFYLQGDGSNNSDSIKKLREPAAIAWRGWQEGARPYKWGWRS